ACRAVQPRPPDIRGAEAQRYRETLRKAIMTSTQNIDARDMTNLCTAVYICYIIGMLMQFHLYSSILGSAIILCVLVFAYVKRKETKGTLFESHFQWMIRSFWIGGAVYLPVATVFVSVFLF